jgi:hypothetical protein
VVAEVIVGIVEPGYHTTPAVGPSRPSIYEEQGFSPRGTGGLCDGKAPCEGPLVKGSGLSRFQATRRPRRSSLRERARQEMMYVQKPLCKPVAHTTRENVTAGEPKLGTAGAYVPASSNRLVVVG